MLHNSRIEATHHDDAQRLNPACEMSLLGGIAAMATLLGEELKRVLVGARSSTAE